MSDYKKDEIIVWPENKNAVQIFFAVGTQWRIGMSGITGLDYCAIYPLIDRLKLTHEAWDGVLDDIRVLEREALIAQTDR